MRIVIILAAISIVGIVITQVYWVGRAFDLRENQFNRDVNVALRNVADKICEVNKTSPANNPVQQLATNYFIVHTNGPVSGRLLELLLVTEFEKRNITSDFEYGTYNCIDQCMAGGNYVSPKKTKTQYKVSDLPTIHNDGDYFAVQFPLLRADLLSQMGIWGFSSIVLFVVILFFIYTLMVILRQRRLSEVQTDFINNMTHEFKTPIATISISAAVLKDPGIMQDSTRLLKYTTIIENETQRLRQQVDRVLQMARLGKEEITLKKELVDIHDLIREAVHNISLVVENKPGKITTDLWARPSLCLVDKLHMTNVFFNLLDNAVKYSNGPYEVFVRSFNLHGEIVIEVHDNGLGLKEEDQRKVFHRFYRVPTGNVHNVKGFGLGLHYARVVVESHKGRITLESELGKGSIFRVTLPAA